MSMKTGTVVDRAAVTFVMLAPKLRNNLVVPAGTIRSSSCSSIARYLKGIRRRLAPLALLDLALASENRLRNEKSMLCTHLVKDSVTGANVPLIAARSPAASFPETRQHSWRHGECKQFPSPCRIT